MSSLASALTERLNRFLADLDEPEAAEAVYDSYTPASLVYFFGETRRRNSLGRDEFASYARAASTLHAQNHPDAPRKPVLAGLALEELAPQGPGQVLAWFSATERHDGHTLYLAVGFVEGEDGWLIDWLTLAPAVAEWDFAQGRLQMVADYPYAEAALMLNPRSWLDVAYYKLHDHPRPPLVTLSDARFSCQGSGACCEEGFLTTVPASAQAVIDAIPWETVAPRLVGETTLEPVEHDESLLVLKAKFDRCRFLGDRGECLIHAYAGRSVFEVCTLYPFGFAWMPEGVAVAASTWCPTVRANVGTPLADRSEDLYMRLAMTRPVMPDTLRLAPDLEADWPAFREAETLVLDWLDRSDLPLVKAIAGAIKALRAHLGLAAHEPGGPEPISARRFLDRYDEVFTSSVPDVARRGVCAEAEPALRMICRNALFSKLTTYTHDLLTATHMLALTVALASRMDDRLAEGDDAGELLWRLGVFALYEGPERSRELKMLAQDLPGQDAGLWLLAGAAQRTSSL